jgi:hypothetical protein
VAPIDPLERAPQQMRAESAAAEAIQHAEPHQREASAEPAQREHAGEGRRLPVLERQLEKREIVEWIREPGLDGVRTLQGLEVVRQRSVVDQRGERGRSEGW